MSSQIPKCVSFAIFPQNSDIFKLDIKLNCIAKQKYIYIQIVIIGESTY